MKTWITRTALGLCTLTALSLVSCEKDETKVVLNMSAAPKLTASATSANITPTTLSATAVTYTWTAADFGYQAGVTYTLQLAKQGTNFASVQEFNVGSNLSKTFTIGELNSLYNALDCNISGGVATPLDVRVKASVGEKVAPAYSSVVNLQATPFQAQAAPADTWGVIGSATPGSWNTDTPMRYDFCTRTWKVTLPLVVGEFKFRSNNAWTVNLGDGGSGDATTTGRTLTFNAGATPNPPNIPSPATPGNYTITLDLNATPAPIYKIVRQ